MLLISDVESHLALNTIILRRMKRPIECCTLIDRFGILVLNIDQREHHMSKQQMIDFRLVYSTTT